MRALIWFVLIAIAAAVAALALGPNDGLVSLYWRGWRSDVSLNLFLIALLLTTVVLVVALRALATLVSLPARARAWRVQRREQAAQSALRESLAEYLGGRYGRAQKAAERVADIHESTSELSGQTQSVALARLLSAASLHRLQDRTQRDAQMAKLRALNDLLVQDAAQLMAAEWALDDGDAAQALAMLSALPPGVARRSQALRLRLRAQRATGRHLDALRTARLLAKHQAFSKPAAQSLLRSLAMEVIGGCHDLDQLQVAWGQLDTADRRDPDVAARAARRAAGWGAHAQARDWLAPVWERLGDAEPLQRDAVAQALLLNLDGLGSDWLPRIESAERAFPQHALLQAVVGAAYAERRLWGKARAPLERAVADAGLPAHARRTAWRQLAALAQAQGDVARATACVTQAAAVD
jgi:HemY protein